MRRPQVYAGKRGLTQRTRRTQRVLRPSFPAFAPVKKFVSIRVHSWLILCTSPCSVVMSQEVLAPPPPEFSETTPGFRPGATNEYEMLIPVPTTEQKLLTWRPIS